MLDDLRGRGVKFHSLTVAVNTGCRKQSLLCRSETKYSELYGTSWRPETLKVGYARVSTKDQTHDLQLDALKKAGCSKIYTETVSGAKADRPVLAKLIDTARAGDVLAIWKLDRLGRSPKNLTDMVTDLLQRKVFLKSLGDPIDTTSSHGRPIFNIFASLAEFEREVSPGVI